MLSFQKACRSHFSLKIQLHYYYFLDFSSLFEFIVVIFPACSRKCENKHKMKKIVSIQSEISIEFFFGCHFSSFIFIASSANNFLHFNFENYTTIFDISYNYLDRIKYTCLCIVVSLCDWKEKFWGQGDFMEVEF